MDGLLYMVLIGAIAGWLGGQIMKGGGFGIIGNIIVGILGGVLGGWLMPLLGVSFSSGVLGQIITSTIGAVLLIFLAGFIKK